jgi:phosphate transport system permease protein
MSGVSSRNPIATPDRLAGTTRRQQISRAFLYLCLVCSLTTVLILIVLLASVFLQGRGGMRWDFLANANSMDASKAGIYPAMMGTFYVCLGCALFTLPIGIGTAIFLEEYRPKNIVLRWFRWFVQVNIANLAGVPSVVYGILGLTAFVNMFGLFGTQLSPAFEFGVDHYLQFRTDNPKRFVRVPVSDPTSRTTELRDGMTAYISASETVQLRVVPKDAPKETDPKLASITVREGSPGSPSSVQRWYYFRLPLGSGVLAGSLTLMLVILPMIIISSQEALRAVPDSLREGALGMGATPWQTIKHVTLPASVPGIMTGSILAMSRAIGDAAPILIVSGIVFIQSPPTNLLDKFSVMPLQIFNWAGQPEQQGFQDLAAAGIIVLLVMLLIFNALAVYIRYRLQKPLS